MTLNLFQLKLQQQGMNILAKKAFAGDKAAIDWLYQHHQGLSLGHIVYGLAYGGHHQLLESYLQENYELQQMAARGFARAKNREALEKLPKREGIVQSIARGFAEAGEADELRAILNRADGNQFLPDVIIGLATTGQESLLLEFLPNTMEYYSIAIQEAAKNGNVSLVVTLLGKFDIKLEQLLQAPTSLPTDKKRIIGYALQGYSEGRHFQEAMKLMQLDLNPMICLNALSPNAVLDQSDAGQLLRHATNIKVKERLVALMSAQFQITNPLKLEQDESHTSNTLSAIGEFVGKCLIESTQTQSQSAGRGSV